MRLLMARAKPTALRWGDKTPHHIAHLQHIYQHYPDARLIHVYRDPRHVVSSLSKKSFPHTTNSPLVNAEVVRRYLDVYAQQKRSIPDDRLLEVRYEDLIHEPGPVVKDVCRFLHIDYRSELLDEADETIRRTIGWPDDKAWGKISPQPVRTYDRRGKLVEAALGRWIGELGYEQEHIPIRIFYKLLVKLCLVPFTGLRCLLSVFWHRAHPGFPFLMQKYPTPGNLVHWLARLPKRLIGLYEV